jgi:hypothetical protein
MKQYNNYADLITFTRASSGTALRPISYGDELVVNGTFDSDSDWVLSSGITISDGVMNVDTPANSFPRQEYNFSGLKTYIVIYEIKNYVSGSLTVRFESGPDIIAADDAKSENGVFSVNLYLAEDCNKIVLRCNSGSVFEIDNISIREVLFDQPDGTLTLFNHPTNIPRIEYDADGNRLGLLVEESRTNLIEYSEDFTQWASSTASLTVDATQSPDGNENATLLASTGFSIYPRINESLSISGPTTLTFSIYVKENTGDNIFIRFTGTNLAGGGGTVSVTRFEFATESFTTASGTTAESRLFQKLNNGWYRIAITLSGDTFTNIGVYPEFAETSTDSTYIYGAQLEEGSFPTSYIPSNSGSTTTRSADVASIGVSEFGYNQSEGTVVAEFATLSTEGARGNDGVFSLEADGDDLQRVYIAASDALNWQMRVGGSTTFATALVNPLVENLTHKIAISFESGRQDGCIDGNSVTSFGTATTMPATASLVKVGYINTGDFLNGHIKSLRYYPRALTATQIQELTS